MPPPTHPRSCVTLTCYETRCPECEETVYYFSCTCGSKVFFDTLFPDWWQHECEEYKAPEILSPKWEPLLECPRCGSQVPPEGMRRHPKRIIEHDRSLPFQTRVKCTQCTKLFPNGTIVEHVIKKHGLVWCTARTGRKAKQS